MTKNLRLTSIDFLRGLVMIIMALDHVRDFFHYNPLHHDPLDLHTTTPILFFTRWITHFCAPIFVFLAGTSAYLSGMKKSKKELGKFLLIRGSWLIVMEFAIINLGWSFNPFYNLLVFQVIWAIGISMIILGLIVRVDFKIILSIGLLIVCCHNLIDYPESTHPGSFPFWWDLIHHGGFNRHEFFSGHEFLIIYPFLPWTGLMILGYCFGKFFEPSIVPSERNKKILFTGSLMILFFVILRFTNTYGDPHQWQSQNNSLYTILSFIDVEKYPPSLLFVCITIGPALVFLSLLERIKIHSNFFVNTIGRVPFFYYIVHIYIIHGLSVLIFMNQPNKDEKGFELLGVYAVWISVVTVLYFLCKWYDKYKSTHSNWWLKYI